MFNSRIARSIFIKLLYLQHKWERFKAEQRLDTLQTPDVHYLRQNYLIILITACLHNRSLVILPAIQKVPQNVSCRHWYLGVDEIATLLFLGECQGHKGMAERCEVSITLISYRFGWMRGLCWKGICLSWFPSYSLGYERCWNISQVFRSTISFIRCSVLSIPIK